MTPREDTTTTGAMDTSVPVAPDRPRVLGAQAGGSRTRRVAFRVLAVLTSLWVLALLVFALTEVVLMWLPTDTLLELDDSLTELEAHRSHYMSIGVAAWALLLGVVVQVRRPHRREAAMLWAVVVTVGGALVHGISGPVSEWLLADVTILVLVLALAALHPRADRLLQRPNRDRGMAVLALVAAGPWLAFGVVQLRHQWRDVTGDIHAEPEHWAVAALMALAIGAAAAIGPSDRTGWRLPAWFAVVASVGFGLHSLLHTSATSALPAPWALAAIAWGLGEAVAITRRRAAPSERAGRQVAGPSVPRHER